MKDSLPGKIKKILRSILLSMVAVSFLQIAGSILKLQSISNHYLAPNIYLTLTLIFGIVMNGIITFKIVNEDMRGKLAYGLLSVVLSIIPIGFANYLIAAFFVIFSNTF